MQSIKETEHGLMTCTYEDIKKTELLDIYMTFDCKQFMVTARMQTHRQKYVSHVCEREREPDRTTASEETTAEDILTRLRIDMLKAILFTM